MKANGCNEDGWDLYEEQTRSEFELYARTQGYDLTRDSEYSFMYARTKTNSAWVMYHKGHVDGRVWSEQV